MAGKTKRGAPELDGWGALLRDALRADDDEAIVHLSLVDADPTRAVHQARRRMKRVRATLALLDVPDHEREIIAAAGRRLGPLRDAQVARQMTGHPAAFPDGLVPFPLSPGARERIHSAHLALLGFRLRLDQIDVETVGVEDLAKIVVKSEARTRRRLTAIEGHPGDAERYHEARKGVKRLFLQYQTLGIFLNSNRFRALDDLGERLGDHHDLSLLESKFSPKKFRKRMGALEIEIDRLAKDVLKISAKAQAIKIRKALTPR